jgi:hypothetical protein
MHEILDAVNDHQMSIGGKISGIAGVQPSINNGPARFVLVLEISLKQTGAARNNLPDPFGIGFIN